MSNLRDSNFEQSRLKAMSSSAGTRIGLIVLNSILGVFVLISLGVQFWGISNVGVDVVTIVSILFALLWLGVYVLGCVAALKRHGTMLKVYMVLIVIQMAISIVGRSLSRISLANGSRLSDSGPYIPNYDAILGVASGTLAYYLVSYILFGFAYRLYLDV